jgi:flavin-dependent dehydrogenase
MAARERIAADICVIGGGPAGSTIAHRLASLRYEVCLIERHSAPRCRIAASLPSSILPLLEVIGARDRVEGAGFLRPKKTIVWWSEAEPVIRTRPGPPGFHVDRGDFDQLLLKNAKANGVSVLQPAQAMHPERLSCGGWNIRVQHDGELKEVTSRFVVDASGGRNILPGRRIRVSAPLLAMYAHWRATDRSDIAGRVEAGENEWFWYTPLGSGKSLAAVFIDPKRLSGTTRENIDTTYRALLGRCRLFRESGFGGLDGPVKACDASSHYAEVAATSDFVKVGDANLSVDPLSSQGVQLAIASGIQAAIVINTLAKYPENSEAAILFYQDRQKERVQQFAAKTAAFYEERAAVCDQPFWQQRAIFAGNATPPIFAWERLDCNCLIRLSDMAKIEKTPAIQGEFIASMPALRHRNLGRPVTYVGNVEIVPLLRRIQFGRTAQSVVQSWSERASVEDSWKILQWLWDRKIIVPMSSDEA